LIDTLAGHPKLQILCRPVNGWGKKSITPVQESGRLEYRTDTGTLFFEECTAMDGVLKSVKEETFMSVEKTFCLALSWGKRIEGNLRTRAKEFLNKTDDYWKVWVKHCSIPTLYQKETIRSALILKLHCFEDTGAILAALTTSLPEEDAQGRNWDYRYCWLRDAYFVLSAFHNLGQFEEMEKFLKFLLNIVENSEHSRERLRPVYCLDMSLPLPEMVNENWTGYRGSQPVRNNNQAAEHIQNDVYGEMVLTLAPIFFDERFRQLRTKENEKLLSELVTRCIQNIAQPDAGLWEIRDGWQEHSFSNLMCWAGIERMLKIQELGFVSSFNSDLYGAKKFAEDAISGAIKNGSLRNGPKDESFDAALLQLPILKFPNQELNRKTVIEIMTYLRLGDTPEEKGYLFRYLRYDDFGQPKSAFLICSFWLVQALSLIGEPAEASRIMKIIMGSANYLGLFSEHFICEGGHQRGNFPQAYSHVGQINAAFAMSPPWRDVL
jgi:GH15 family glucan-1,4-alpha-glucosidase